MTSRADPGSPLSAEDLGFWYADQPRQRSTMAMLLLLDRAPDPRRLEATAWRMVESVPRLRERIVDAPLGLALPRWQEDPTFDLAYHVRRYAQADAAGGDEDLDALFRRLGPIYERPFDRTRPLWELIEIERPGAGAAVFFRLHHAVADGVGGNAILAALTDAEPEGAPLPPPPAKQPGAWPEPELAEALARALRDRVEQDAGRARAVGSALWRAVREPRSLVRAGRMAAAFLGDARHPTESPLRDFGRARRLTGFDVAFEPLREARHALGGTMVDVLLTAVAGAARAWHRAHGHRRVAELETLVPINLRQRAAQGLDAGVGNRATGILVRLPIGIADPVKRFREVHRRVEERKTHPSVEVLPVLAELLAALPRPLYRAFAYEGSKSIDLIVTNVPGVPMTRYLGGAAIEAAYPFAPVAPHCPVSVALYGYRDRLYVGLDADATSFPDVEAFRAQLARSFEEVVAASAGRGPAARRSRRAGLPPAR
jgi:diacylglycerol O-acyltransferase